ncbi:nuclear transport factor 2 [Polyplosphaeria fusca]|uniref:Nuclear transport factor 2 n=1 Tax=Polyplosphaeria fusca TaxID=682080 RepID=A0A9P4V6C8_9PLEO|nr:nuclear transport factor 2 [Polyplosphaeria fusca]
MADFQEVGKQFIDFYYQTFDGGRPNLAALYRESSMLTFEGTPVMGVAAIIEKLTNLPFEQVQHRVDTSDCQPGDAEGKSIVVLVTGALMVDGQDRPMSFTQNFVLKNDGSWHVFNDMFRLVYPAA